MGVGRDAAPGTEQYVSEEQRIVAERLEAGGLTVCARLPGDDPQVLRAGRLDRGDYAEVVFGDGRPVSWLVRGEAGDPAGPGEIADLLLRVLASAEAGADGCGS
jgi:hypothetical protein